MTDIYKPKYTTKQILYGAFSRGALTGVTNKDPMINDWLKILDDHISTAVREARIDELQLLIVIHDNDPSTNRHGKSIVFARSLLNERLAQLKEGDTK